MSDLNDDPRDVADRSGLEMVLPGPRELFIDLDSHADIAHHDEMMGLLAELAGKDVSPLKVTTSAGGNTHAYLLSRFLSEFDDGSREQAILRIALQACLGSDRKRELLSLLRVLFRLDRPPTVFFERPGVVPVDTAPVPVLVHDDLEF